MSLKNSNELSLILQQYQLDYYTKGNALKVHSKLTNVLPKIEFNDERCLLEFQRRYEDLKSIEDVKDINDYSKKFAENLLKLILSLTNSKFLSNID